MTKSSNNFKPEVPKPTRNIPGTHDQRRTDNDDNGDSHDQGRRLVVGQDISMSGNIRACDKLMVEGEIDATMEDGHELEVTETGIFRGTVTVDQADIRGYFEGDLTVRGRLTVQATGHIVGTIRYHELTVAVGGRISGNMEALADVAPVHPADEAAATDTPATTTNPESESETV